MAKAKVCVIRTAGTNCDQETAFAFTKAGAGVELVHIGSLLAKRNILDDSYILAIPGGFTYGDDLGAGKILANELKRKLTDELKRFIKSGKLIIGICNGFQVLVKSGILAGNQDFAQDTSLILNDSAKFEDRWVYLKSQVASGRLQEKCVWTKDLAEVIYLPVAHGEGKFITQSKAVLERLRKNNQIVFQYCDANGNLGGYPDNPNGSVDNIAGICDETGRVLGLMPHPERHISGNQHPRWEGLKDKKEGDGLQIFRNAVEYVQNNL